MPSRLRRRVAASPIARGAAFPLRTMMVARYDAEIIRQSLDWLLRSRETTNLTYDLHPLNRDQLCWFVAAVSGAEIGQIRIWIQELEEDTALFESLAGRLSSGPRRRISATEPHWARRLGWYALVRAAQPDHVVETGTQLGLGSCAIAAALLRNGHGRLTTIDIDADAGHLIAEPWASVIDRRTGDSAELVSRLRDVDLFLHDSLHTYEHEASELAAVEPNLRDTAIVLSDNAHETSALADWAERNGRRYLFFAERPQDHWWRGDGIGAAWRDDPSKDTGSAAGDRGRASRAMAAPE